MASPEKPQKPKLSRATKCFMGLTLLTLFVFLVYSVQLFGKPPGSADTGLMIGASVSAGVLTILSGMFLIYGMILEAISKLPTELAANKPEPSNESATEQKRDSA